MIIYVIGYGRSGSTRLSLLLQEKLGGVNLGEAKFLYRSDKDDLLDDYWKTFKQKNGDILEEKTDLLRTFDGVGGFRYWNNSEKYWQAWEEIFRRMGLDPAVDLLIDTSKTTMDSFMRGLYLKKSFGDVYFVKPSRNPLKVFHSMLRGKNSSIERGERKRFPARLLHTLLVGIPHYILTHLFTLVYKYHGYVVIDLDHLERDTAAFLEQLPAHAVSDSQATSVPMIYGNRSRKESPSEQA